MIKKLIGLFSDSESMSKKGENVAKAHLLENSADSTTEMDGKELKVDASPKLNNEVDGTAADIMEITTRSSKKVDEKSLKKEDAPAVKKSSRKQNLKNGKAETAAKSDFVDVPPKNKSSDEQTTPKRQGRKRKSEGKENIEEAAESVKEDSESENDDVSVDSTPPKKANTEAVVKKIEKKGNATNPKTVSNAGVPKGWTREIVVRKKGRSAGACDVYYYNEDGIKFRSKPEVANFLADSKSTLKIDDFNFSKRGATATTKSTGKAVKAKLIKKPVNSKKEVKKIKKVKGSVVESQSRKSGKKDLVKTKKNKSVAQEPKAIASGSGSGKKDRKKKNV